jgi:hypothetical protein
MAYDQRDQRCQRVDALLGTAWAWDDDDDEHDAGAGPAVGEHERDLGPAGR